MDEYQGWNTKNYGSGLGADWEDGWGDSIEGDGFGNNDHYDYDHSSHRSDLLIKFYR